MGTRTKNSDLGCSTIFIDLLCGPIFAYLFSAMVFDFHTVNNFVSGNELKIIGYVIASLIILFILLVTLKGWGALLYLPLVYCLAGDLWTFSGVNYFLKMNCLFTIKVLGIIIGVVLALFLLYKIYSFIHDKIKK